MRKNIIWISLFSFCYDNDSGILYRICKYRHFSPPGKKQKESRSPKNSVASDYKKLTGRDSVALKGIANIIKKNGSFYLESRPDC